MNNIPEFKENDKIVCIENYDIANNFHYNPRTVKYEPTFIMRFKKNKIYQILHIEYNRNSEKLIYIIKDDFNVTRGIDNEDFKQIFTSLKKYRILKLQKLSEYTK